MKRYPELDVLRGFAILLMVVYHAAYDLAAYKHFPIAVFDGPWRWFAHVTAGLFLLLVGVSFAVSASRKHDWKDLWKAQWKRFWNIGVAALLVSAATYLADPQSYVRFGILHLIALSALLLPFFRPLKEGSILIGLLCCMIPTTSTALIQPLSMILGYPPPGFVTVDYFPLSPWFGIILIGYGLGHFLYVRSNAWRPAFFDRIPGMLTEPGKHSLAIYLLHQPIILGMLWLLK